MTWYVFRLPEGPLAPTSPQLVGSIITTKDTPINPTNLIALARQKYTELLRAGIMVSESKRPNNKSEPRWADWAFAEKRHNPEVRRSVRRLKPSLKRQNSAPYDVVPDTPESLKSTSFSALALDNDYQAQEALIELNALFNINQSI